jgi:hypothetical protein
VGAAVLAAAFAFPVGVIAGHGFTDVPTGSTFHADIEAIADAGVTLGCSPTTYCPKEFVTREQMAAFLNRLGALGPGKTPVANATKLDGLDSTQFVRSDATVQGESVCPGNQMMPALSTATYATSGSLIYATGAGLGAKCQFRLPDGATITTFRAAFRDTSNTENAGCRLEQQLRNSTSIFDIVTVQTTNAGTPGDTVLSSSSGLPEVVNNGTSTYVVHCSITGSGTDIGVFSAAVEYTFAGLPVE